MEYLTNKQKDELQTYNLAKGRIKGRIYNGHRKPTKKKGEYPYFFRFLPNQLIFCNEYYREAIFNTL